MSIYDTLNKEQKEAVLTASFLFILNVFQLVRKMYAYFQMVCLFL